MIKNIVFDFGNVLVSFDPRYMTRQYVKDEGDVALVSEVLFDRLYWDKLDAGTITDGEVVSSACERLPERLHGSVEKIYYNWIYNIPEIPGMREIVERVRGEGKSIYLLSNICEYFAEHVDEIDIIKGFDRLILSARAGHVKPHADMFEYLCRTCGIVAEETLFIDDNEANIEGARAFGINAYLFDGDVEALGRYLDEIL